MTTSNGVLSLPIVTMKNIQWRNGLCYIRHSIDGKEKEFFGDDPKTLLDTANNVLGRALTSHNQQAGIR